MRNVIYYLLFFVVLSCGSNRTIRQGTFEEKDGKVVSAKGVRKCTRPDKRYTKTLTAKLDAEFNELNGVPLDNLDAEISTKAVKLVDYTSEGLDRALAYFYICQMANNRTLTDEQISTLINNAQSDFDNALKKKNQQ